MLLAAAAWLMLMGETIFRGDLWLLNSFWLLCRCCCCCPRLETPPKREWNNSSRIPRFTTEKERKKDCDRYHFTNCYMIDIKGSLHVDSSLSCNNTEQQFEEIYLNKVWITITHSGIQIVLFQQSFEFCLKKIAADISSWIEQYTSRTTYVHGKTPTKKESYGICKM